MTQVEALAEKLQECYAISTSDVVCSTGLLRDLAQIVCTEYCTWEHLLRIETLDKRDVSREARAIWCALNKLDYRKLNDASIQCRFCRLYHPVWGCIIIPQGQMVICYRCNYKQKDRGNWSCCYCHLMAPGKIEAEIYYTVTGCNPCFFYWRM